MQPTARVSFDGDERGLDPRKAARAGRPAGPPCPAAAAPRRAPRR